MLIRRLLTIPTGIVFFVSLLITLVVLEVNATFMDVDFHPEQLRKADIYNFLLVDLLASGLDEAREIKGDDLPEGLEENPLVVSKLSTERIVSGVNRILPPEWVQEQVEQLFDQFGRYITGRRDSFEITIEARERVEALASELKALAGDADLYDLLLEEEVTPAIEEALGENQLPLGLSVSSERLVQAFKAVVTSEWIERQAQEAVDEVTPYIVGDKDSFEIRVELDGLADNALLEIKDLLQETNAYNLVYDEVIGTFLEGLGTQEVEFLGLLVSRQEILSAMKDVAPLIWVQQQAELVIDEAGPYITGRADSFRVDISLVDNKRDAVRVIGGLVDQKLRDAVFGLPFCTPAQVPAQLQAILAGQLPACIPPDINVPEIIDRLNINLVAAQIIDKAIPDQVAYTQVDLRRDLFFAGGEDAADALDQVRDLVANGWTYSDVDLDQDEKDLLDDARAALSDCWVYTEEDFREDLVDLLDVAEVDVEEGKGLRNFDMFRSRINLARNLKLLVFIPLFLSLVSIGFMGGRGWYGRLAWAGGYLAVTAGIIFIVSGPIYDQYAGDAIDKGREEALEEIQDSDSNFKGTVRLAAEKGFEVATNIGDEFSDGVARLSGILALVGLVGLGGFLAVPPILKRYRGGRRPERPEPEERAEATAPEEPQAEEAQGTPETELGSEDETGPGPSEEPEAGEAR